MLRLKSRHRIMCGDSTNEADVAKLMAGEKAVFCFTSPPYSDQRDYRGDLKLDTKHLAKFMNGVSNYYAVNLGLQRKNGEIFPYWNDYIDYAKKTGLKLLSWSVWDKLEAGSVGNQTAIFPIEHEWIFLFGKENKKFNKIIDTKYVGKISKSNSIRNKDGSTSKVGDYKISEKKMLGTVCRQTPYKAREGIDHPAMFPVALVDQYYLTCTDEHDIVYEPFTGSGTSLISAQKNNRVFRGMEISPEYMSVILKRWEDYTGEKAVRL